MKLRFFVLILTILTVQSVAQERKLLIIGVDGCRPDALMAAETPTIDELIANSTYTLDGLTNPPTYSGPGWSSMTTGVWEDKHGVTDNSFNGSQYDSYPHFFNHLKSVDPDLYLASICQWHPINDQIVDEVDFVHNAQDGPDVTDEAVLQMAVEDLDVMFLHYDDVDLSGHSNGFSADNPLYIATIESVDAMIAPVISAMEARPNYDQENWLVIVSTDHGGIGFSHGGGSYDERNIFLIFSGDNFPNEEIQAEYETTYSDQSNAINLNQNDVYAWVDEDEYDFGDGQDFTVELKLKASSWGGDPSIISDKNWNSGYNPGFVFALQNDLETWKFNLGDGDDRIDLNGGSVNDDEWHHLAVSVDRDGETILMHDGEVIGTIETGLQGSIISGLKLAMGQDGTLTYDYDFDGWLDEVRIWTEALDPSTIQEWSCLNLTTDHPAWDNNVGYWKMEEIGDLVVYDTSPYNNHATLVNGPYLSLEGEMECSQQVNEVPRIVDIVYTSLVHLCIEIDLDWELDGQLWGIGPDDCEATSIADPELNQVIKLIPNPNSGQFRVEHSFDSPVRMEVYSSTGDLVQSIPQVTSGKTLKLDLPNGMYTCALVDDKSGSKVERMLVVE